jgi:hypothetical protein
MYDNCASKKHTKESKGPFSYITESSVMENNKRCFLQSSPFMRTPGHSIPSAVVQLESELRNQTKPLGRCDENKNTMEFKTECKKCGNPEHNNKVTCTVEGIEPIYTRLDASFNSDGYYINRRERLDKNPLPDMNVTQNSLFGANTRLQVRDAYKTK